MTEEQFNAHWKRLENKYPTRFQNPKLTQAQNEDHKNREWTDWYDSFIKLEDDITESAFNYYFRHLATNWFPEIYVMCNIYHTVRKEKAAEAADRQKQEPFQRFNKEQIMVFKQQYYKDLELVWPGNTERFARKNGKDEAMRLILGDELYNSIPERPESPPKKSYKSNINYDISLGQLKKHYSGTKLSKIIDKVSG